MESRETSQEHVDGSKFYDYIIKQPSFYNFAKFVVSKKLNQLSLLFFFNLSIF